MMFENNTKAVVRSPDGDIAFFDINAGVLQGDALAPYLFILSLLWMSIDLIKENGFTLKKKKKARNRRYLSNTPVQAESQQLSVEQAARGISLYVNANKSEDICFFKKGAISTLSGQPLKLVDHFTYLGINISSTEGDANISLAKA